MTISFSTFNRGTNRTLVAKKHKNTVIHSILNIDIIFKIISTYYSQKNIKPQKLIIF